MRFTSIWFRWIRGYPMPLKEKIERTKDLWSMNVYDILPKRVRYWVAMRAIGHATKTSQNVPATSLDNVLQNLLNIREGKPLEQFVWHESMRFPEDDHSEHVHVAPLDLDKMTSEERDALPKLMRSFIDEKPLHERPLDNGKNGGI